MARQRLLSASRPPAGKSRSSMTRRRSKQIINHYHQIEKDRTQATAVGNLALANRLSASLEAVGGLGQYQAASLQGQRPDRGGDTSSILVEWLQSRGSMSSDLRLLEIGALAVDNACARSRLFCHLERIDLKSQHPDIICQDFMTRPLPATEAQRFDVISLSLVLNFVPTAAARGNMLRRTVAFLSQKELCDHLPGLFLVLPAACLENSRYLSPSVMTEIMDVLGYAPVRQKVTKRLAYSLWRKMPSQSDRALRKRVIREGAKRNNFCITLSPNVKPGD